MGLFGSLFGWASKLAGLLSLLKHIPGLSMIVTLSQAAFAFVKALQAGDIAGAFKSLIGPAIDIGISLALPALAGTPLGQVGDKLADSISQQLGPALQGLAGSGLPQGAIDDITKEVTNFENYLRSPAFTAAVAKSIGHDVADTAYVLTGSDVSVLKNGLLSGFDSLFSSFLTSGYAMKGFTNIMNLNAKENTGAIISASQAGSASTYTDGLGANPVNLTPVLNDAVYHPSTSNAVKAGTVSNNLIA